jgi:hypothetical protein
MTQPEKTSAGTLESGAGADATKRAVEAEKANRQLDTTIAQNSDKMPKAVYYIGILYCRSSSCSSS